MGMVEWSKVRGYVTLGLLILSLSAGAASAAEKLYVTGSLWTPYIDADLPEGGLATDLVRTALTDAGYELEAKIERWPRAYEGAAIGLYDVVAAVWRTAEREQDLLFSEPYLFNDIVLLTRPGVLVDFQILEDLAGYRIGVVRDYAYDEAFDNHPGLTRVVSNQLIQNLLLLRQGRLGLVIADRFRLLAKPVASQGLTLGVSKQNPNAARIVDDFNKAVAAMKADNRFAKIVEKHQSSMADLAIVRESISS